MKNDKYSKTELKILVWIFSSTYWPEIIPSLLDIFDNSFLAILFSVKNNAYAVGPSDEFWVQSRVRIEPR